MSTEFKQDNIRALSEREKAREKLPVFYGSYDNFYHGFRETLNNSCDEILNNFPHGVIDIILSNDNRTITVRDTGRGIPISTYENTKLLFETLFASGKYDVSESTNSGVNGVGNTILQFSSEYFKCLSHMKSIGKAYEIVYENGGEITTPLTCLGDTDKHGTEITFKLDDTVYTEVVFDEKEVEDIIRKVSLISKNITFNFTYKNNTTTFNHDISEYFDKYSADIIGESYTCASKRFERDIEVERKGIKDVVKEIADIQVVFGACSGELPMQETMLNGNYLKENGTIYDGVIDGFKLYVNRYCKENNLYKKKEKGLSSQDIENAISFVCRLFNNLVEFESQVKFSTKKEYYKQVAKEYIQEQLEIYKLENEKAFKRMVEQVLICKRANDVNIQARQKLKDKLTKKIDGINETVDGFVDCDLDKGGEIFLVEGKSANGSIVLARNSHFQASYPLRGKLLNLLKAKWKDILDNNEITDIIRLLGCGVEVRNKYTKDLPEFNIDNLRFNKIILTADADSDGHQINTLILTALYVLTPTLIKKGYVYIAQPPIFQIDCGDIRKYAMSVREKDEIVESFGNKKVEIHRLKGLGETSAQVMAETVCDPDTRILQEVKVSDVQKMKEQFRIWMDDEVKDRKEIITKNLNRYLVDPPVLDVVESKEVENIIQDNMMDYSSDVIFDRALVSIESGLKPSQLRSIYAMYKNNVTKLTKSKNVTGYITQYHPHGSAYDTIVNMCQEDRHLNPLVDYEGNMGQHTSKDLMAADERYTNIKLSKIALDGLKEIDSHFVKMIDTYDNKRKMPLYLPNKYPLVLTQSTQGMAVGMASKTPSFNMNEVNNAIITYLKTKKRTMLIPDFATGGQILNNENAINSINTEGKGSVRLRGKYDIDGNSIIFYEIPYGVRREDVINKAIAAIKSGKLKECIKVKDLTDLKGMKIKFEFKKNTDMNATVAKLFKLTPLESSFDCNMNVLYKGLPSVNGVWSIIDKWLEFRKECLINGMDYQIDITSKELHKLEGFEKITDDLDKVIEIIRFSKNVREDLIKEFDIDEVQSEYIEKTQLINLNEIKIKEQTKNIENLRAKITTLNNNKSDDEFLNNLIIDGLKYILKEYPTQRRSEIVDAFESVKVEELLIDDYNVVCYLTESGYFKKVKSISNKGNNKLKDGDSIKTVIECNNKDELLVFGSDLCCHKFKLHALQEDKLSNLGQYLPNVIGCDVLGMSVLNEDNKYICVIYKNNKIAKVDLKSFETKQMRSKLANSLHNDKALDIITLKDDDIQLKLTVKDGREKVVCIKDMVSKSSRNTQGVNSITWKNQTIEKVEIL